MICLPVLAVSREFWLNKFRFCEMGAELPAMTSRPRRVCAKRNLRRTLSSGLFCGNSMQQNPFPRPVSSKSMFSFWLSGLCLVTFINLAPPIAALHHGKTVGSGERCLSCLYQRPISVFWYEHWTLLNSPIPTSTVLAGIPDLRHSRSATRYSLVSQQLPDIF